ncbi:MAG TPA: hypothetical protein VFX35_09060 [Solirubrobacterales bacterium]|nr:hypothetical protein [Solirubrobacterales bacterium]
MRLKLIAISLGLVSLAALIAFPGMALAFNHPLVVENGVPISVGSKVLGTNVGATKLTTSLFNLECSTGILTGTVTKNTTGTVEGTISSARFGGTGGKITGAEEPECTSHEPGFGDMTVTPSTATNGLPWCIRSTEPMAPHEFQVRGNECAKAARPIRFSIDMTGLGTCQYERGSTEPIPGTFTTSTTDSVLSISEVNFPAVSGNPFGCPGGGKLDMTFTMETDASPFTSLGITE